MRKKVLNFILFITIFIIGLGGNLKVIASNYDIDVKLADPIVQNLNNEKVISYQNSSLEPVNNQIKKTKREIIDRFNAAKSIVTKDTYFDQKPEIIGPNYREGILSELAISDTLKQLNFYRYLADVNEIGIREENMILNGRGAVLLSVSDFSHHPAKPQDMSDEFYYDAEQGTSFPFRENWGEYINDGITGFSGNVSSGIELVNSIGEYIDDTTNLVIGSIGHRLSLLVPNAVSTSFGYSDKLLVKDSINGNYEGHGRFTAISVFHGSKLANNKYYTWPPAGYCPIEVTEPKEAWSVTLDSNYSVKYNTSTGLVDSSKEIIKVTYNNIEYVIDTIYYDSSYNTIYFSLPDAVEAGLKHIDYNVYDYYSYKPGEKVYINISGSEILLNNKEVVFDYYVDFFQATEVVPIKNISLNKSVLNLETGLLGEKLIATVSPDNATYKDLITWESSNVNVATVLENGYVRPVAVGSCEVFVKYGDKKASCIVNVIKAPSSIEVKETSVSLKIGDEYNILYEVLPNDATNKLVTFLSSDENIISVDEFGKVTAIDSGIAKVTLKTVNNKTKDIEFTVETPPKEIKDINVNVNNINLYKGETFKLKANVVPEDTTFDKTIKYTSLNEEIVLVDEYGNITIKDEIGSALICLETSNNIKKYVTVNVIKPSVKYTIQVKDEGWHNVKKDGAEAARNKSGNKIEAIKLDLDKNDQSYIEYNVHMENVGWQGYKKNSIIAGKENGNLRIEGIKIRLSDNLEEYYDVYYRVHIEKSGWLTWAKNDEVAGSSGYGLRVEGIQVVIVPKGEEAPEMNPAPNRNESFQEKVNVIYSSHIEKIGWQGNVRNGATSGAPGRALRIEGIKIKTEATTKGSIEYKTHVQNKGWLEKVPANTYSGTTGLGLRTEAVMINLTGDLAENFDVFYRIHVEGVGWLGWAKNGEEAGSTGYGKKLEGIEIKIFKKGDSKAPITGNSCMNK